MSEDHVTGNEPTIRVTDYKRAVIKFNNGYGALLCNKCSKIVKRGFDHPDVENYCSDECKPPVPISPDPYGFNYRGDEDYFG